MITPNRPTTTLRYEQEDHSLLAISMDEAVRRVKESARDGLVLFVGAGISAAPPSNCPTWEELLDLTLLSAQRVHPDLDTYYELIKPQLNSFKPELLCQVLYNNLMGDFFAFLDILDMGQPNSNHYHIAQMTREFVIPVVFTTNFDVHIETALSRTHSKYRLHVSSCPRSLRSSSKIKLNPGSESRIIKVHGSLEDRGSIVLTLRQAGLELRRDLSDAIRVALQSYTVLVVGYSGNDDDIFPVFLSSAPEAKRVFWALWEDEKSITHNIHLFARDCPNCTLVAANKNSIFEKMVDSTGRSVRRSGIDKAEVGNQGIDQKDFLMRWASRTNEHCWKNFFFELFLVVGCNEDVARLIATDSERTIRTVPDQWVVTKALVNRAHALIVLKDYDGALAAISKAAENYMVWGHHREVIECLTVMITKIPLKAKWRGDDPLFWSAQLSGKTYDPYGLGLYNYSAGMRFLTERRWDLAQKYLLAGGGYAKRCGDTVTLVHSLEGLGELFGMKDKTERARHCREEVARLRGLLGISQPSRTVGEGQIIKDCEEAAKREIRKVIAGEVVIVVAISVVLGAIACLFVHQWPARIGTFVSILAAGAAVKVWNAVKRFIKYTQIDRV